MFGYFKSLTCFVWVFAIILLLTLPTAEAQVWEEWVEKWQGTANSWDEAEHIAVDPAGHVYVAGFSLDAYTATKMFITIKYNTAGTELWSATGPVGVIDGLVVDAAENSYVVGDVDVAQICKTVKYNANGIPQWGAIYPEAGQGDARGNGIVVDADGNVYITGRYNETWTSQDILTIKYNSFGNILWVNTYDGYNHESDSGQDVTLDAAGNVYVAGNTETAVNFKDDFVLIKYDSEGLEQWVTQYNSSGDNDDEVMEMVMDQQGNFIITGFSGPTYDVYDITTVKIDSNGALVWDAQYNGSFGGNDEPCDLAVDAEGHVYVTGFCETANEGENWITIKYSADGVQEWAQEYNGPSWGTDQARGIAVDDAGFVYVTGYTSNSATWPYERNITTVKYNPDGDIIWEIQYDSYENDSDRGYDITLDAQNNVLVTGYSKGTTTHNDFVTVKYNQHGLFLRITALGSTVFPVSGGMLEYNLIVGNQASASQTADFWMDVILPDGTFYGPILGPIDDVGMDPGWSINRDRELVIPSAAPGGIYYLNAYLGDYDVADLMITIQEQLAFTKEGADDGGIGKDGFEDSGALFAADNSVVQVKETTPIEAIPNPFNLTTVISYQLSVVSHVTLTVYDISGRKVADLVDGWRGAGLHEVMFDGTELVSGVYFYQLEAGDFSTTKKMLLLK